MKNVRCLKSFLFLFVLFSFLLSTPAPVHAIGTAGVLSGKVVDKDTGKPIENVFITAKSPSDTYTASTDANGFFSIAGVPSGSYDVSIERVGYQTATYTGVTVTGDATTNLSFILTVQPIEVTGVTVSAARAPVVNPRQTMTNYGYTADEINKVFPGPQSTGYTALGLSYGITPIYESLPGVQIGFDSYYGAGSPHIRGGTGSDIAYAFDGVPTYETVSNTFGSNLSVAGTARTDFYVGGYPAEYGNFLSGFINQVTPRGSGGLHGRLQYQTGFWADSGAKLPTYDSSGTIPTYNGWNAYSPTNINLELQGKDRRLSYYFNHLIIDTGTVGYPRGIDLKPLIFDSGALERNQQSRDTVLNLNYDLNNYNGLQLLLYHGIERFGFEGLQELPCNASFWGSASCISTNTATGFGETYSGNVIAPLPDYNQIASYDMEKFEWTHRFQSPGKVFNLRLWHYNPQVFFDYFAQPSPFWEFRRSSVKGTQAEYQNQITTTHLLDVGGSYVYSNNFITSDASNINFSSAGDLASGTGILYNLANPAGTLHTQRAPDTITWGAWVTDEWRPSPKWNIYGGLRYDRQAFMVFPGIANTTPFALNVPGYTNGTPFDLGFNKPSLISPRVGASYKLSDKLTMKASYGKFVTFAPARRVEALTGNANSTGTAFGNGISKFITGFVPPTGTTITAFSANCPDTMGCYKFPAGTAEWLAGSKNQIGETIDVSWEYSLDDNTYVKMTPYIKHIKDPLQSVTVAGVPIFTNAGTIVSKGIELYLKSRDWHGLSGWLSYTYSSTKGTQLPFQTDLQAAAPFLCSPAPGVGCSATGPFSNATAVANATTPVPTPYDQRHVLSLNLNYKLGKWDLSPNFIYGSGYPYGLGLANLQALAALQDPASTLYGGAHTVAQSVTAMGFTNPLNENGYNGLRQPGWWLGNMSVTYHVNPNVDTTFTVLNIFNSNQIIDVDNTVTGGIGYASLTNPNTSKGLNGAACCYVSNDGTQNVNPQYNPLKGQYAPVGYPNLRQFFFSINYKL